MTNQGYCWVKPRSSAIGGRLHEFLVDQLVFVENEDIAAPSRLPVQPGEQAT